MNRGYAILFALLVLTVVFMTIEGIVHLTWSTP
jgi:hypothetical protein